MAIKRVFLIVLDSVGIGELPDAADYGDVGSNTVGTLWKSGRLNIPNLKSLGFFNIDGMDYADGVTAPKASFGRIAEASKGKDTTIGHWEISGIISPRPLPTYPDGFPKELLDEYSRLTGRGIICNKPFSGTEVLLKYGQEQKNTGDLIVYTSADSVFQVAAHEEWIGLDELYKYCEIARELLKGEHSVGRVIARPFVGEYPDYKRTSNRHDYSMLPPATTMLNRLVDGGLDTIGIGKIYDIFAGQGINSTQRTTGNSDGLVKTSELLNRDFTGLAFVNLVDFDMLYGHRKDIEGYTDALNEFDSWLGEFLPAMGEDDLLMITADHGCDPGYPGTDHTREYIPIVAAGKNVQAGVHLGTRTTFSDIAATITDIFDLPAMENGTSFKNNILK